MTKIPQKKLKSSTSLVNRLQKTSSLYVKNIVSGLPEPARYALLALLHPYECKAPPFFYKFVLTLAIDVGIKSESALINISNATLLGCIHSAILDDIIDSQAKLNPLRDIYLVHLLFVFYVEAWLGIQESSCASTLEYPEFVRAEIETYNVLFDEELNHVGLSNPFESAWMVGRKCSPVKAVVAQILRISQKTEMQLLVFNKIERGSTAILLCDDLADWEEDYTRRRFTYPIQLALDSLGISYSEQEHAEIKDKVFRTLWFSPLINDLFRDISENLQQCAIDLSRVAPNTASLFESLHESVEGIWREYITILEAAPSK